MTKEQEIPLQLSAKIAAFYLLLVGLGGLAFQLAYSGVQHAEFEAMTSPYKAWAHAREVVLSLALFISSVGLLTKQSWARNFALVALIVSTPYLGNSLAWGFANGTPSSEVRMMGIGVALTWNALWIYLLYRKPKKSR